MMGGSSISRTRRVARFLLWTAVSESFMLSVWSVLYMIAAAITGKPVELAALLAPAPVFLFFAVDMGLYATLSALYGSRWDGSRMQRLARFPMGSYVAAALLKLGRAPR